MDFSEKMALWTKGIAEQAAFWTMWTKSKGYKWPAEFETRLDAQAPLRQLVADLIPAGSGICKMMDVGAGPLTCLGKVHPQGHAKLEIEACDPLAKIYNILLQINQVQPVVQTKFANVENLSAFYPDNHYDITNCRNALDHSLDPMTGLIEMLRITKVGGYVVLDHELNEGVNANYAGFHQYNFDIQDGRFIIWNPSMKIDVASSLPIKVDIRLQMTETGMFMAFIHKLSDFKDKEASSRFRAQLAEMLEYTFDFAISEGMRNPAGHSGQLSA